MVDVATLGVGQASVAVISIKLSPTGLPVIAYDGLSAGFHGVGLAICSDSMHREHHPAVSRRCLARRLRSGAGVGVEPTAFLSSPTCVAPRTLSREP